MPERDDRKRRRAAERLELVVLEHELVEQPSLPQVVLDRDPEGLGSVGAEREPELERPERAGILERDVDHVAGALMRDVRLLVSERLDQVIAVADEEHATRLRQVEPLVRVEGDRVGAVEAGEEMAGRRRRGSGQPIGAVHVQPDAQLGADVGERTDRIDRAGERRPAVATTATGTRPSARSARIASRTASGGSLRSPSIGSDRTFAEPIPRISAARSIE